MTRTIADIVLDLRYAARTPQKPTVLGVCGAIVLLLAVVGIYSMMAYAVSQRRHEFGARMALGASARDVLRLSLRQATVLTATGLVIGVVLAGILAHLMSSALFGVVQLDRATLLAITAGARRRVTRGGVPPRVAVGAVRFPRQCCGAGRAEALPAVTDRNACVRDQSAPTIFAPYHCVIADRRLINDVLTAERQVTRSRIVASEAAVRAANRTDRLVRRSVRIAVTLLLCIWSPAVLAQQKFDRASQSIRDLSDKQRLPSVVVAVAKNGRIVWEEGFGWADVERQVPATPHTPYSLASVSKPFTATAVMKLVDAERLVLDRSANDYLGDARITGRDPARATVRRILSHTAGLPPFFRVFSGSDPPPIEEIITRYAVLTNPAGRRHVYSNLGYGILEHIIGRISGLSYDEFMRREVFVPLGLEHTSVPRAAPADAAVRYDARGLPLPYYDVGHRGASAIYASAHDLIRFGMFHLQKQLDDGTSILKRGSIEAMQRIQTHESPTDGYGLGWRISEDHLGFRHVSHTGGMPGVTTVLSLFPGERVVVVVLTNAHNAAVVGLAQELAALVMPQYGWRLRQAHRSGRE